MIVTTQLTRLSSNARTVAASIRYIDQMRVESGYNIIIGMS